MKRVALVTLIAVGFIPLFCIAEDGSVSGEKKYSASETDGVSQAGERKSLTSNERRQKIRVNHRYRTAMAHWERAGFCRDAYCSHASRTPWWPGPPGD